MNDLSISMRVFSIHRVCVLLVGGVICSMALAQNTEVDPLAQTHVAINNQDWRTAEALLRPLTQGQSANPFALYDLAQVYENTNRIDLAKKIYQNLLGDAELIKSQPTLVIRAPYASRMVGLLSLAQTRLNSIDAKQVTSTLTPKSSSPVVAAVAAPVVAAAVVTPPIPAAPSLAIAPVTPALPPLAPFVSASTEQSKTKSSAAGNILAITPESARIKSPSSSSKAQLSAANLLLISQALKAWANAWVRKDMPGYYASYTQNFRGLYADQGTWKAHRSEAITTVESIVLELKNIEVTALSDTRVRVDFLQSYQADSLKREAPKTLLLTSRNGPWLIDRESIE